MSQIAKPFTVNRIEDAASPLRPCAKTMLRVDQVDDIADDTDVDSGVITERDIRVDHDNLNLIDNTEKGRQELGRAKLRQALVDRSEQLGLLETLG